MGVMNGDTDMRIEADGLEIVAQAFKHNDDEIGVSFNGGKDSVVMLHLLLRYISIERANKMCIFVFDEANEFEEMTVFRDDFLKTVGLTRLVHVPQNLGIRGGLKLVVEKYHLKAVLLGTRSSDPNGKWQGGPIEHCSPGWPDVIRYCPVFNWSYAQIWRYILKNKIEFCVLYERGFTSIGGKGTTFQNPLLKRLDGTYRPAWELDDESKEREGRHTPQPLH